MDTTDILFICGGAFDGLEKVIRGRAKKTSIGFDADVRSKNRRDWEFFLGRLNQLI